LQSRAISAVKPKTSKQIDITKPVQQEDSKKNCSTQSITPFDIREENQSCSSTLQKEQETSQHINSFTEMKQHETANDPSPPHPATLNVIFCLQVARVRVPGRSPFSQLILHETDKSNVVRTV